MLLSGTVTGACDTVVNITLTDNFMSKTFCARWKFHLIEHQCELFVPLLLFGDVLLVVFHLCVHAPDLLLLVTGEAERKRGNRGRGRRKRREKGGGTGKKEGRREKEGRTEKGERVEGEGGGKRERGRREKGEGEKGEGGGNGQPDCRASY